MAGLTAHFPHPGVLLHPAARRGVGEVRDERSVPDGASPNISRYIQIAFSSSPYTSSWTWSHAPFPTRTGDESSPAAEGASFHVRQVVLATDPVHDLERASLACRPSWS